MIRARDPFSWGVIAYAACLFVGYRVLIQASLVEDYPKFWPFAYALIIIHILGWLWCAAVCLFSLRLRQLASFAFAALLVISLQGLLPRPLWAHFWLHKDEFLASAAVARSAADRPLSIVLFSSTSYIPSMPGGHLCATEIVYDNSNDPDLISQPEDGRAAFEKIDENFYLRYPPCG